jgi:hypothetical protein
MKVTCHLYLVKRLRISAAEPPFTLANSCRAQGKIFLSFPVACLAVCVCFTAQSFFLYALFVPITELRTYTPRRTAQFADTVCAPLSLLMLPALCNDLRGDTDSTEYELENVLLFLLWLLVLSLLLKSVSIHFFLLLPWILGHWMLLAALVPFHVRI